MSCAIWGTPAQVLINGGAYQTIDSARAGGKYWISVTAIGVIGSFNERAKQLLTTWLCEQRQAGVDEPKINSDILDIVKARQFLPFMTRFMNTLRCLGDLTPKLGDRISLSYDPDLDTLKFLAETESSSVNELMELLRLLQETGFIEATFHSDGGLFRPTAHGWEELDKLKRPRTDSSQAFVAMWFSNETTEAYVTGIVPALTESGYKAMRIDKKDHNNKIDDEIIAEIRRSRFVVADFTCEPEKARGGVYFEAGFALGLNIPVIWTCKDSSLKDVHFDTRQYAHITWKDPIDLYTQLKNRIGATIGLGPLPMQQ
jgi:DNA-binding PadR family transcriptional regulator